MDKSSPVGRTTGLVVAGALAGAALVGAGVALADGLPGSSPKVTYVKENRTIPPGYLSTNVVCPEGQQAIGGGFAHVGEHQQEHPVIAEISAPSNTSGEPDDPTNAWTFFFVNDKKRTTPVEVHVICTPIDD
ncbi:hypothetical protein [[Actinomadura] parvosata]|uniref:hypothetical protein n=1 Tax=[Actinomadura] parvosata TaxID=1955412 RepID=UPI0012BCCF4A|nr:hypothetical protein [Nonomuraea sp. ATCC 55076]